MMKTTVNKEKWKLLLFDFVLLIFLIVLDQVTKYFAVLKLKDKTSIPIINGVFELHYLENKGAAFGMLQNQKIFFIFVAVVILSGITYLLFKIPEHKKYRLLHFLLVLIAGGAIGNMIDRISHDYVVDFFYFVLINFPIFNVADMYVSVSCVLLVIVLFFYYKEEDLEFLNFQQKKIREIK